MDLEADVKLLTWEEVWRGTLADTSHVYCSIPEAEEAPHKGKASGHQGVGGEGQRTLLIWGQYTTQCWTCSETLECLTVNR